MELTPSQLTNINHLLPSKYHIDQSNNPESNPSTPPLPKPMALIPLKDTKFSPKPPEKHQKIEVTPVPPPNAKLKSSEFYKKLASLVSDLKKHEKYSFFSAAYNSSHSLSTVETRLNLGEYSKAFDFAMDVRKIWNNSFATNAGNREVYSATVELSVKFEQMMSGCQDLVMEAGEKGQESEKGIKGVTGKVEQGKKVSDRPLGFMEKKILCSNIKKLEPRFFKGVLDIVKDSMDVRGQELEFDIESLPPRVCRELDKYVKQCLANISKSKKKNTIEQIKNSQKETQSKIAELDDQLESVKSCKKPETLPEESESESSSTSESEEDLPSSGFQKKDEDSSKFSASGPMLDFDRIY